MTTPHPLDELAYLRITDYGGGSLAVEGNVGDVRAQIAMLEPVLDSARRRLRDEEDALMSARIPRLLTGNGDIDRSARFPVEPVGDRPLAGRPTR